MTSWDYQAAFNEQMLALEQHSFPTPEQFLNDTELNFLQNLNINEALLEYFHYM